MNKLVQLESDAVQNVGETTETSLVESEINSATECQFQGKNKHLKNNLIYLVSKDWISY